MTKYRVISCHTSEWGITLLTINILATILGISF